jgi:hypothetical protein
MFALLKIERHANLAKSITNTNTRFNSIMFEQTFKNIDDILYKDSGADSELDYIGQTSRYVP